MLRLEDSPGVIQKGGRGPVNEFGQDSEKRKSCLLGGFLTEKKPKTELFLPQKWVLRRQKTGVSKEPDPVGDERQEVCAGWGFSA